MDDINHLCTRLSRAQLDVIHHNHLLPMIYDWTKETELSCRINNLLLKGYILVKEGSIYKIQRQFSL